MSAGTVISGGFPGRVAQEVNPNQKCSGCLHYDGQAGRTGVCTIGDSPWKCGDGDAPNIGYAPLARGAGSYLPDMNARVARAPEVEPQHVGGLYGTGSTQPVRIHQVSLGEEHVHVVKSVLARHGELQKSQCLRCSAGGTSGSTPHSMGPQQPCSCKPIEAEVVAKAVIARMSNAQRVASPLAAVTLWVREVAKAGFKLPASKTVDSLADVLAQMGVQVGDRSDDYSGGHLTLAKKPAHEPSKAVMSKSMYSDDWIAQFKGTTLFEEARKLCEQELKMEEEALDRRQKRTEREKKIRANTVQPDYDWQEMEAKQTKIRIAKQRLALKLAGLHQEKLAAAMAR